VITHNATISACGKSQQWQRTLELLEKMLSQRLQADVITYSALISACVNGKQWQRAFEWLVVLRPH
jgi:pentatricopeptide repeat domain-containing protein 1